MEQDTIMRKYSVRGGTFTHYQWQQLVLRRQCVLCSQAKTSYPYEGLTVNDNFILITCNAEKSALGSGRWEMSEAQAESTHLPWQDSVPTLLAHIPELSVLPRSLGLSHVPLPTWHLPSLQSSGLTIQVLESRLLPFAALRSLEGWGYTEGRSANISFLNHLQAPVPCQVCTWHFGLTTTL